MVVQATGGPELAGSVLSPLLTKDTIDFLNYTVSADERQLWMSLGDSWMKTRAEWPKEQFIPPYVPRFRSGWEPRCWTSWDHQWSQISINWMSLWQMQQNIIASKKQRDYPQSTPVYQSILQLMGTRHSITFMEEGPIRTKGGCCCF